MGVEREKEGATQESSERDDSAIGVVREPTTESREHDPRQSEEGPTETDLQRARVMHVHEQTPTRFVDANRESGRGRREKRARELRTPLHLRQWRRIVRDVAEVGLHRHERRAEADEACGEKGPPEIVHRREDANDGSNRETEQLSREDPRDGSTPLRLR